MIKDRITSEAQDTSSPALVEMIADGTPICAQIRILKSSLPVRQAVFILVNICRMIVVCPVGQQYALRSEHLLLYRFVGKRMRRGYAATGQPLHRRDVLPHWKPRGATEELAGCRLACIKKALTQQRNLLSRVVAAV